MKPSQCPLCGAELSQVKSREVEARLRRDQQNVVAAVGKAETAMRERLEKQFQAELVQQKLAAEQRASEQNRQQLQKLAAERDGLAQRLALAGAREAEIRKQAQQEAEVRRAKDLLEQQQLLEKDKVAAVAKEQTAAARAREALIGKVQLLEAQLRQKTSGELGDGMEIDVYEALREAFPEDRISRVPKGQAGADIIHEVLYKGSVCGRIITDAKNRRSWQNSYITKLRHDKAEAGADHAVLASSVFPAGKRELCIESGVIVVAPARAVYVVQLLRQAAIAMHIKGLGANDRTTKMSRLYELITSESYRGKLSEAGQLTGVNSGDESPTIADQESPLVYGFQ